MSSAHNNYTDVVSQTSPHLFSRGIDFARLVIHALTAVILIFWSATAWPFPWNLVAGILTGTIAAVVWAFFFSPRPVLIVGVYVTALIEIAVTLTASISLWQLGWPIAGSSFAIIAVTCGIAHGLRRIS